MSEFKKAVKYNAKLRMAIAGPSGAGKTYTALRIGAALANGGKVALVDTEHESASKYADLFEFDTMVLMPPFHPNKFIEAIGMSMKAGYTVLILDSLSHAWSGPGGLLNIVDEIAAKSRTLNTFVAWKDATPIQQNLVEAILRADLHVIGTMRTKQEYIMESIDRGGRTVNVPRKIGLAPIQRDGFEYEFDIFMHMDQDHNGIITKTRCPALKSGVFKEPGENLAAIISEWLTGEPIQLTIATDRWNDAVQWLLDNTSYYTTEQEVRKAAELEGYTSITDASLKDIVTKLKLRAQAYGGKEDDD